MEPGESLALIRRKIVAHGPPPPQADGPLPLLFTACARVAERRFALPLALSASSLCDRTSAEIVETLPDQPLMLTMDGPRGGLGLAVLDQGAFAAWGEVLAIGALSPAAPPVRRPTRTDAILIADLLDAILGDFDDQTADQEDRTWSSGFRYSAHLADPRPLALMLEEPAYRVLRLEMTFGTDGRRGEMQLFLPARGRADAPDRAVVISGPDPMEVDPARWQADLAARLAATETDLVAVFARVTLPLSEVFAMVPGQSLVLPPEALDRVQIEGPGESLVCLARLGQVQGQRAVCLRMEAVAAQPPLAPPVTPTLLISAADQPLQRAPAPGARHDPVQGLTGDPLDRLTVPEAQAPVGTADPPLARTA